MILLLTSTIFADIGRDMTNFFNKFGAMSNSTKGSSFSDQQGGYYSGGSLFIRSPSRNLNPVQVTPPGFRMGCGGIDIWTGGFSYINAEQMKQALNAIVSNGVTYAFMLAVETYAPQVHNIMQQLNKLASDFNKFNINSCETAAGLVGSMWPKTDLGSQAACRMMAVHDGGTTDFAKARHQCGQNPTSGLSHATKDQLVGSFNVAWIVLEKINFDLDSNQNDNPLSVLGDDSYRPSDGEKATLKELFMTFSGTIIRNDEGKKKILPPLGDRESFLKALMSGGKVTIYKCDRYDKCLNPTKQVVTLDQASSLQPKILKILETLSAKIQDDDGQFEQTKAEESLINATSLPLYKFINVTTAYQKGRSPISLFEYSEMIAFDVVLTYVNDVLMAIREATVNMKDIQFNDDDLEYYLNEVRKTQAALSTVRQSVFLKFDQMLGFIQKTQLIEKELHHMMGSLSEFN